MQNKTKQQFLLLSIVFSFFLSANLHAKQNVGTLEAVAVNSLSFNERSFYRFINKATQQIIDIENKSVLNDANIILADADIYSMHQAWRMDDIGNGIYNFSNAHNNKVMRDVGDNVRQERDGKSNTHRWEIIPVEGGYFRIINVGRKSALTAQGANVVGASFTGSDTQLWKIEEIIAIAETPDFSIQGFATVGQGTTGGAGGATVIVRTESELKHYMQHPNPYIILIEGTITLGQGNHHSPQHNMHSIAPNKTLFGLPGATIKGGGFNIRGTRNDGIGEITRTNIIIRNLIFDGGAPDDYINIEHGARNVWIDHNTFNGPNGDGMVDVKREASLITISWNIIHSNHKTMLLGHDDKHTHDRGHLMVTYHNNYIYNSQSRHPRIRYGKAHLFNNYFENTGDYVMGPGIESEIISENNHVWISGRYTDWYHNTGKVLERGNGSLVGKVNHDMDGRIQTSQIEWKPEDFYSYKIYPAIYARNLVLQYAGAGIVSYADAIPEFYTLTISKNGSGIVNQSTGAFGAGTSLNVLAQPANGWEFNGWSGDITSNENPLVVNMNANISIVANFIAKTDNEGAQPTFSVLHDWNFSNLSEYSTNFAVTGSQTIANATLYDGIAVDGMGAKTQIIDNINYSYTRRVKLGGSGVFIGVTPSARVFAFHVPGNSKITIVCQSSSSSDNRSLNIANASNNILATISAPGANHSISNYEYIGPPTTIYLYSPVSGVNLYHVRLETVDTNISSSNSNWVEKRVVSEIFYNLNAVLINKSIDNLSPGVYVRVRIFENGERHADKIVITKQ